MLSPRNKGNPHSTFMSVDYQRMGDMYYRLSIKETCISVRMQAISFGGDNLNDTDEPITIFSSKFIVLITAKLSKTIENISKLSFIYECIKSKAHSLIFDLL